MPYFIQHLFRYTASFQKNIFLCPKIEKYLNFCFLNKISWPKNQRLEIYQMIKETNGRDIFRKKEHQHFDEVIA